MNVLLFGRSRRRARPEIFGKMAKRAEDRIRHEASERTK
jgi:hypothetical protein